jgi:hypothetical protein
MADFGLKGSPWYKAPLLRAELLSKMKNGSHAKSFIASAFPLEMEASILS